MFTVDIKQAHWREDPCHLLSDAYINISYRGVVVGDLVLTRYDWAKARELSCATRWLIREPYLMEYKKHLFDPSKTIATLPPLMLAVATSNKPIIIVDSLRLSRRFHFHDAVNSLMHTIIHGCSGENVLLLLSNWVGIGQMAASSTVQILDFFHKLGMLGLDHKTLVCHLDGPSEQSDCIDEEGDLFPLGGFDFDRDRR